MMKKILWLSGVMALWLEASLCAGAQPPDLVLLRNVHVATVTDSTRIALRFNKVPHEEGITYQGDFVQIEFPDTYVDPPKQWISVGDSIIKNIFLYQWSDTAVRMRLFTHGKGEGLKDKITLSKEGKKIFIQYPIPLEGETLVMKGDKGGKEHEDVIPAAAGVQNADKGLDSHSPLTTGGDKLRGNDGQLEGSSGEASVIQGFTKDAENSLHFKGREKGGDGVVSGETSAADPAAIELPAADRGKDQEPPVPQSSADTKLIQSIPADQKMPVGGGVPNLYASLLKMVAALGVLIALLFAVLYLIKRVFGKKMGIAGQDQSIRVVTTAYLGPKKTIALVDIAGERIVVGITQDHISMLTKVGQDREFKEILQEQTCADEKVELKDELWEKV